MASRVGDKQTIIRQETGAYEAAEDQATLRSLPPEVFQMICLYAGPKACAALGFVCKDFYVLAFDKRIWVIFVHGLGHSAMVLSSRIGVGERRDFPRIRDLSTHLRKHQFLVETTEYDCAALPIPTASSFDLCYFYCLNFGEVINVWTKKRELTFVPEPDLPAFFEEMSALAAVGLACIDDPAKLEEVIQTLQRIDKRFWDLKPWIALLSSTDLNQVRESLQNIQTICEKLSTVYTNLFQRDKPYEQNSPEVVGFAANEAWCVADHESNIIEVYDRRTKVKLASILNDRLVEIGFLPNCICILRLDHAILTFYNFESGIESSLENVYHFQVLNDHELLIDRGRALTIRNLQTDSVLAFENLNTSWLVNLVFDQQTGLLAIVKDIPDDDDTEELSKITTFQLTKSESTPGYSLKNLGSITCKRFARLEWKEGFLYVMEASSLIRVEPDKHRAQTLWAKPKNFNGKVELVWEGDTLHVARFTRNGLSPLYRHSLKFFVTESELIKDLANRYRKEPNNPNLDKKFFNLPLGLLQPIFSHLPALNSQLQGTAEEWERADSQTKAGAIELFLLRQR